MAPRPNDSQLDRLLGGKPDLAVTEREAMLKRVLQRTAVAPAPVRRPALRWVLALAAGVLVAVPAVYLGTGATGPDLVARGGALLPSFTASCLVDGRPGPCARGARLAFEVTPTRFGAFAALAEAPDGTTLWFFPGAERLSLDVSKLRPSGIVDQAVLLDGPAGSYLVHGVFSLRPMTQAEVRVALTGPASPDLALVQKRVEVR